MADGSNQIDDLRDWLLVVAASASAAFAGLIWVLARKRLKTRYQLSAETGFSHRVARFKFEVFNRSDDELRIEKVSVEPPLSISVDGAGASFPTPPGGKPVNTAQAVLHAVTVPPESNSGHSIGLVREGGFKSCKSVSITLHILKTFPVMRHKKKVLTTILPARIRNSQE